MEEIKPQSNNYIMLSNEIYDNLNITNEELTVLIMMYRNYMKYKGISLCSIELLINYMQIDIHNNRKIINIIKSTIKSLIDKEYISNLYNIYYNSITIEDIKDKNIMFYVELKDPPEDNFFMVQDESINKIFKSLKGINLNKFNLIRYYIACCRVRNNEQRFGYLTQTKLKQLISDSRSIQRYNTILQDDLHLIKYCNDYLTQEKHYCTTFIGDWNDEENFKLQLECQISEKKLIHISKIKSNIKRSTKQKINYLEKEQNNNINNEELSKKLEELEKYKALYGELNKNDTLSNLDKEVPQGY